MARLVNRLTMNNQFCDVTSLRFNKNNLDILIFVKYYLPGYKAGGAIRSIVNIVDKLGDEFNFSIVTSDRDWTDVCPYNHVFVDSWNQVGKARVFYLSPRNQSLKFIVNLLSNTKHDLLYLNSFFDPIFTQKPLWARCLYLKASTPLVIAPRGEFSVGAYSLKIWKKELYRRLCRTIGLFSQVIWHASTNYEAYDIKSRLKFSETEDSADRIIIASDIPSYLKKKATFGFEKSKILKLIFLSRISPKKNLDYALRVLMHVTVPLQFSIYGPKEEDAYWLECQRLIKKLPSNIIVNYMGGLEHSNVNEIFQKNDLFFFPTMGENYGHVIIEALSAGTPVLISNTTPWLDLERAGVGWDLPLNCEQEFAKKIIGMANLSGDQLREIRLKAYLYAEKHRNSENILNQNRELFKVAIRR